MKQEIALINHYFALQLEIRIPCSLASRKSFVKLFAAAFLFSGRSEISYNYQTSFTASEGVTLISLFAISS